jgi:hypothetical protein
MRILDDGFANPPALPRTALLSAERAHDNDREWTVSQDSRKLVLRAFADIDAQHYSAYQDVEG